MKLKLSILFFIILMFFQISYAKFESIEIKIKNEQPYKVVVFDKFENDTLYLKMFNSIYPVSINSIEYIKIINKSRAGLGFLIGTTALSIWTYFIYTNDNSNKKFFDDFYFPLRISFSALLGGGTGVLFGSFIGIDTKYNFDKLTIEEQRETIIQIMDEQKWGIDSSNKRSKRKK